jgi:uncharacterized protein (TIGR02996 family)
MNEAALLAACDAAPAEPVPRLVLADCLEEAGTPGRAAAARLVRMSAQAIEEATPAAKGLLTRRRNRLLKDRPSTAAWFDWWFGPDTASIVELSNGLDRRRLARFVVRCAEETPRSDGGNVMNGIGYEQLMVLELLTRFADGGVLTKADWQREEIRRYTSSSGQLCLGLSVYGRFEQIVPSHHAEIGFEALALADVDIPPSLARWAAVGAAMRCEGGMEATDDHRRRVRELHRRILHECVPCPFDPEGDE